MPADSTPAASTPASTPATPSETAPASASTPAPASTPRYEPAIPPAIELTNVHEIFKVYTSARPSIRERLTSFKKMSYTLYHALNDVSVRIMPGERVGLIGHNGSGKSTLLKVMAKILPPDQGTLTINGRMATLLELGAGFSPELTGRENMYLNGSIIGLTRAEVDESFDRIVDFAGIRDFIDMPVKNYSSGMYVRLGFAIAVHVNPDILLVDEVLAVGDQRFQERSLARMRAFAEAGKTVVLVSHDLTSVQALCDRVILLEHGHVVFDGPSQQGIAEYHRRLALSEGGDSSVALPELTAHEVQGIPRGDGSLRIDSLRVTTVGQPPAYTDPRPPHVQRLFPFTQADPTLDLDASPQVISNILPNTPITVRLEATPVTDALLKRNLAVRIALRRTDIPTVLYDGRSNYQTHYIAAPPAGKGFIVDVTLTMAVLAGTFVLDVSIGDASSDAIFAAVYEAVRISVQSPPWEVGVVPCTMQVTYDNPDGVWPPDSGPPPVEAGGPRVHPSPLWPIDDEHPDPSDDPSAAPAAAEPAEPTAADPAAEPASAAPHDDQPPTSPKDPS